MAKIVQKCTVYKKGFLSGCICVNERKVYKEEGKQRKHALILKW